MQVLYIVILKCIRTVYLHRSGRAVLSVVFAFSEQSISPLVLGLK